MVCSWIGGWSGSSVHVPCVASLLLRGVEEGGGRFRVVAVVRIDHVQQRRLHVLAHRDRTADVEVGAALQPVVQVAAAPRSEAPTSTLQSLLRLSYAVFCLHKKVKKHNCAPVVT